MGEGPIGMVISKGKTHGPDGFRQSAGRGSFGLISGFCQGYQGLDLGRGPGESGGDGEVGCGFKIDLMSSFIPSI